MARDAVVLEQALRWPKAASSRSGRSGAVFVGRRPELLGSGAAPLHAAVPRDHLRQLVGAHAAGWLCDADNPHFSVKHLYVGASRATSAELVSVCRAACGAGASRGSW